MAKKGFFSSLISSIVVGVISFFILYFGFPQFSEPYLGVSFKKPETTIEVEAPTKIKTLFNSITSYLPSP